jgi:hypothetical protein
MTRTLLALVAGLALAGLFAVAFVQADAALNIKMSPAPTATAIPSVPKVTIPGVVAPDPIAIQANALCNAASNPYAVIWDYDAEKHILIGTYSVARGINTDPSLPPGKSVQAHTNAAKAQGTLLLAYIKANIDPAATLGEYRCDSKAP